MNKEFHDDKLPADHIDNVGELAKTAFEDVHEEVILTEAERRRLKWKLDIRLMPMLFILYWINLVDRAAVGASVAFGFRTDLKLVGNDYNIGVSVFFIFYFLGEVPSNLILKKVGGNIWLPTITILFGICSLGTAFIHNYGQFIVVRILLALTECGTTPGVTYYLSTFYDKHEISFRVPFFLGAGILSTGIGPFLANAYVRLGEITPAIHGWRIIFFCNAMITFGLGAIAFLILPAPPERTKMLTERERTFIMARSKRITAGRMVEEGTKWELIGRAFTHPYVLFGIVYLFVANIIASTLTYFLALILTQDFGFTGTKANTRTGAVFLAAFGYNMIVAVIADKTRRHAVIIWFSLLLSIIGAALFMYAHEPNTRYAGAFLAAFGAYGMSNIAQGWYPSNIAPYTTRAVACGLPPSVGSLGGIVACWVFIPAQRAKGYPTGKVLLLVFTILGFVTITLHWFYIKWENKQRDLGKRDWRLDSSTPEQQELLGSLHPHFRYTY